MKQFLWSLVVATILTGISYAAGFYFNWFPNETAPFSINGPYLASLSLQLNIDPMWLSKINLLELFAVFTSYSCTYLCVMEKRINYPIGFISTAALCYLFYSQQLYASAALNFYLPFALVYGWFRWKPDADTRPVTRLALDGWLLGYIAIAVVAYGCIYAINTRMGNSMAPIDTAALVLSILAQFLLDNKKLESWIVWMIVDVISIKLYAAAGLPFVAFQMGVFLLNAFWGYWQWRKSMIANRMTDEELVRRLKVAINWTQDDNQRIAAMEADLGEEIKKVVVKV